MNQITFDRIFTSSEPVRLDIWLTSALGLSRSIVQRSIRSGAIAVNNSSATKSGVMLQSGDRVVGRVSLNTDPALGVCPEPMNIAVIYEDDYLLVLDKPPGLTVHPTGCRREGTLVNGLLHKYAAEGLSDSNDDVFRPGIVHRLDKDTSGLMVVAKANLAHQNLSAQLADRTLGRTYWAIVSGNIDQQDGSIEAPIGRSPVNRKLMAVVEGGKYAKTEWQKLQDLRGATLLEVELRTGRTHQIRVHMQHLGMPILGDRYYGGKRAKCSLIARQCLHAKKLRLLHPITGEMMKFESDLPADIEQVLLVLRV